MLGLEKLRSTRVSEASEGSPGWGRIRHKLYQVWGCRVSEEREGLGDSLRVSGISLGGSSLLQGEGSGHGWQACR